MEAERMLQRLAALCARTEQCECDLREKMRRAGLTGADAEKVLARLREGRFLDEGRFARAFAADKVRFAGWGRGKIRMALARKRVPRNLIEEALAGIDRKEYMDALKRAGLAKARSLDLTDYADVQKLYRHMVSRGFETELVGRLTDYLRRRGEEKNK